MALTSTQIASRLFKQSLTTTETATSLGYNEEPISSRLSVFPSQIWAQSDQIPSTANPSLKLNASAPGSSYSVGVVKYFRKHTLKTFTGTSNKDISFWSEDLIDAIPLNFDPSGASYVFELFRSDGTTPINFGNGDWLVDTNAGVLTFYGTTTPAGIVSSSNPPKISFYKYIGPKGLGADSGIGTILGVTAGVGLTGGGTAGYITLDVNLGINSGLTFSGDDIVLDNIAGNGLDFSSGVLTVNTSEITTGLAGYGLTANGSSLDVNVGNGLDIISDTVYLGGTLSKNTDIEVQTNTFAIQSGVNDKFQFNNTGISIDKGNGVDSTSILLENDNMDLYVQSGLSQSKFIFNGLTNNSFTVVDGINSKGIVYDDDYTGNFTTHSLVTKQYVDSAVSIINGDFITGVTAGVGLTGGGAAGYITLDVNLGIDSGLTFSGDDIVLDTNIAGNGLDFSSGVLTVNTSEINTGLAGNGLTANGSTLDVNVNSDSLEIVGDVIRLKDTITGNKNFNGDVFIQGSFSVAGSSSVINTVSLVVSDPIIALGHTQTGSPVLDEGFMFVRGTGLTQAFIWDESEDTFALITTNDDHTVIGDVNISGYSNLRLGGLSASQIEITTGAQQDYVLVSNAVGLSSWTSSILRSGTGLQTNGVTVSLDFNSITGTGLTQNGSVISIDTTGFASDIAGDGLIAVGGTLSVNVGLSSSTGLTVSSDILQLSTTGVTAGTYGSSMSIPTFTVDSQGRLTNAGTVSLDLSSGSSTIAIGPPEDLTGYTDGIFTDFTPATPIGTAIDRFNEMFLLLAPTPPGSWAGSITSISFMNTPYSPRVLNTGAVISPINRMFTSTTPTLTNVDTVGVGSNAKVDTNGFTFSLVDNGSIVGTATLSGTYTVAKGTGNIQHSASVDPYTGVAGQAGFWKGITSFAVTGTLPAITPSSSQRTLELYYPNGGYVTYTYYIDSPLTPSITSLTASIPAMTSKISGVPTLTSSQNITSVGFDIPNVSSHFYAPIYVWSVAANLVNSATGDPDSIPASNGETGVVSGRTLVVANNVFSDTSFSFTVTPRNSTSTSGTPQTLTTNFYRVDTKSNESSRKTSGSGSYPSTAYNGTYDSLQSLVGSYGEELQLKNSLYVYPSVDYTNFGGPNYSGASGLRWATFNLGSITGVAAFTLTINGLSGISSKTGNANFFFEVKVDGSVPSKWVDGDAPYPGSGNPGGGLSDGDPANNESYPGTSASVRRITFGGSPKTGNVVVRIGWNNTLGTSVQFTSIAISDLA